MELINHDSPQPAVLATEELRRVPLFENLPEDQLCWLIRQGRLRLLDTGDIVRAQGTPADYVFVLLDGAIQIVKKKGNQEILLVTHTERTLFGELPVLTGDPHYWAEGRALAPSRILELDKEDFWELLSSCRCVTTVILRTMAQRMQEVQALAQQRERLIALGTLAAGLAHELNNPASAARRAASQLRGSFQKLQPAALKLCRYAKDEEKQAVLNVLEQEVVERATAALALDPITRSDREEQLADWLREHNIANSWNLASTLVGAGLDTDWLVALTGRIAPESLPSVLNWLEVTLDGVGLLNELEHCTERVSTLVQAVKDYSYLDQAPLQEIDVHEGLESTLTMLGHRLRNGIAICRAYCDLPRITAFGSELNQVWTNLLDNAIDAVQDRSDPCVWLRTSREDRNILVEITDNGPGIAADVLPHIFEPFFTTKDIGKGTGLGLHISYRIVVEQHRGDIRVHSAPGRTCFQVRLPITPG
ncbi:sensor histidine kinase [Gloeobacter kilaueensis]|uniref:histidine kinase n=1 Tax=Gloeobacter kilaueensis (strain ATCC BAA-2537 / CCAP 1431/1 / ULC 316 / JS1) TaxID=1183438 RepID=U5QNE0_GLOK1|nr:ATP-binding protein [Gloeobacter kilaueensis]AGY59195.1 two-component sensor histidine kinase [Gloeobacter kilaueensis JS1]